VVVIDEELGDLGAAIRAEGWLIPLGEDAFDDARRRLGAQAAFDPVERSVDPPRSALFTAAASIRRGLVDATRPLDPRRAGLLRGLAIGDESGLDGHTEDTFRATGLSHLLAVSGSNVAIVVATVSAGAAALGLRTRLSLCALGLGLFVLVVGPEPSVLRAAVMGGIGLATLAAGRRAEPLHALGLALVILFGLRPGIVFSVGLHLSVAATAGIVLWSQRLAARLEPFVGRAIALALGATLAAQAAVAPLLAGVFGELSVVAPAANLVAVPAVPPATVLALAAGLAGVVSPGAGAALGRAAEPFAAWILGVADVAGRLSWAAVEVPTWTGIALAPPLLAAALAAVRRLEAPELV
jgi:competence protein ComEC